MENDKLEDTILRYETFINEILKEDLKRLDTRLQQMNEEIKDLIQQKQTLKIVTDKELNPTGFKTQLDVGCNFFMEASVTDTSKLLMNVGLNHYVEFTLFEANIYLDARIRAFERVAKEIREKIIDGKAHMKLVMFGLGALNKQKEG